ncbi:hypothetical protein EON65_05440 [archaeon]|nr:MAG: hypothetical protein EON65_05440 [archaeon]
MPYSKPNMWTFAPEDILILQFDSRELKNYWNTSAYWNNAYANTFGHAYQYMSMSGDCHNGGIELSASWCKVKAMLEVSKTQKQKVVIFLDSDAIITTNHSMSAVLEYVSSFTGWNVSEHPVAFNQDGPGYACRHALKIGYNVCLNSGTVIWVKSKLSTTILAQWWNYAKKIGTTLFEKDWRKKVSSLFLHCTHKYTSLIFSREMNDVFIFCFMLCFSGHGSRRLSTKSSRSTTSTFTCYRILTWLIYPGAMTPVPHCSILMTLLSPTVFHM